MSVYTPVSVSGYNSSPPSDDGSTASTNKITWSGIKTKLSDPLNTFASSIDANLQTAFATLDALNVMTTRGDIITRGASAPARFAIGTSGQLLSTDGTDLAWHSLSTVAAGLPSASVAVSSINLTSGSLAASYIATGTALQVLGTDGSTTQWQTPFGKRLASGTASGSTLDLVLTSYTSYRALKIVLTGFQPVTNTVNILMRTSTDGGNTYDSGASNYQYAITAKSAVDGDEATNSSGATSIQLNGLVTVGNASTASANVEITLWNQTSTAFYTQATWTGSLVSPTSSVNYFSGAGCRATAADVDAVRFLFSSGNINAGNYAVYGLA